MFSLEKVEFMFSMEKCKEYWGVFICLKDPSPDSSTLESLIFLSRV